MRVNQGITLLLIGVAGLILFNIFDWQNTIFYFVIGVGLARVNDWWGEAGCKEKKQKK